MLKFITKIYRSPQASFKNSFKLGFPLYSFAIAKKKIQNQQKKVQYSKKYQNNKKSSNMMGNIAQKSQDQHKKQVKQEKLDEFNTQIMRFLQQNINEQTMINWALLSNIYHLIKISQTKHQNQRASSSRLNPKVSRQIKRLFQNKIAQTKSQHNWKFHQMVIDSINLLLLIQYSNFPKKILNDFILYLHRIPTVDTSQKPQKTIVIKFQNSKNGKLTDLSTSNSKFLNLLIQKYPLSLLTELSFRMIKLCENRSKQELFDSIKVFSSLLNVSELKQLDELIYQKLVLSFQSIINQIQNQQKKGYLHTQSKTKNQNKLTFKDVSKIVSIFSQLKLKLKTMELCQQIFSIFIQTQFNKCYQNIQKLQFIKVQSIKSLSDIQLYPLDFSSLIKIWIGMTDIGMFDLQQNVERLLLTAFKMNQLAVKLMLLELSSRNKTEKSQKFELISMLSKIKLSQKQVVVTIGLLHRFKKGNYFFEEQIESNIQSNKIKKIQNIWTYLVKSIIGSRIMQQYISHQIYFFILSGVCRSLPQYYLLQNGQQANSKLHNDLFFLLTDIYKNSKLINLQKKRSIQQFLEQSFVVYSIVNCIVQQIIVRKNQDQKNVGIVYSILKDFAQLLQKIQIENKAKLTKIQKQKIKEIKNLFLFLFKCLNLDLYYFKLEKEQKNHQKKKQRQKVQTQLKQQIKLLLKKCDLTQNEQILINILLKNYDSLKNNENKRDSKNYNSQKERRNDVTQKIKQYKRQLNMFLGLSKSIDQVQYLNHLTQNYLKNDNQNIQNQQTDKQNLKTKDLIEICQSFKTQVVLEQILRIKLIRNQEDFNHYTQT